MSEPLRIDVLLHRLCVTRSRNEAKTACDARAVLLDGRVVKASEAVNAGDVIAINFPRRVLELRVLELPPKSTSKKRAREMYELLRDEPVAPV